MADVETVSWRPAPYVELVPEARLADTGPGSLPAPGYPMSAETHDVTGFYPDIGPEKDLEAIISERINNEVRVQSSSHVIKERDHDHNKTIAKKNSTKSNNDSQQLIRPPVDKVLNKVQNFKNQIKKDQGVTEKNNKGKIGGKWPEVSACYTRHSGPHQGNGTSDTGPGQRMIDQLNNLRKVEDHCSQDVEVVAFILSIYCAHILLFVGTIWLQGSSPQVKSFTDRHLEREKAPC